MPEKEPRIKSTKSVYTNQYVEIVLDTLELDNEEWEYVYFVKPNNNSVGIIPIDNAGLYLVRQYRHASRAYLWQIIGGMIEEGDSEVETAKKELEEEAGIRAEDFEKIGSFIAEPGMSPQEISVYVAKGLKINKNKPSVSEVGMTLEYFPFEEIDAMIGRGEIRCGLTLSSLMLLKNNYLFRNQL